MLTGRHVGGLGLGVLHERDPVRFLALTGLVAKQRPLIGKGKNFADPDLGLVPFEDQELARPEHPEGLSEAFAQIVAPVIRENSVLQPQPACTR